MNGLKHGRHSPRVRRLVDALLADLEMGSLLRALASSPRRKSRVTLENSEITKRIQADQIRILRTVFDAKLNKTAQNRRKQRENGAKRPHPSTSSGWRSGGHPVSSLFRVPRYTEPVTRTILFDVDQTLLYTGGAGSTAMARAFEQLYGIANGFQAVEYSGRTDWFILRQGLEHHGLHDEVANFDRTLPRFIEAYLVHLPVTLRETPGGHVKPGVPELLNALAGRSDARLGLATGNFKLACLMKLDYFELDTHLRDGGFGEDAEDRGDMVAKAIARVSNGNAPDSVWIVGDTVRDIEAAAANGARSLAVATGASTVEELLAAGADIALEDLSNTAAVLDILFD